MRSVTSPMRSSRSCVRHRPERSNHVWPHGFVQDRTRDGRKFRMVTVLADLMVRRGAPDHTRSGNESEFAARAVRDWIAKVSAKILFIEPGSPWGNGHNESFNGKLQDELFNVELFNDRLEAKVLIERWRRHYNAIHPHTSLGYQRPAPEAIVPLDLTCAMWSHRPEEPFIERNGMVGEMVAAPSGSRQQ